MSYLLSKIPQQAGARTQKSVLETVIKNLTLSKFVTSDNFHCPGSPKKFSEAKIRAPQITLPRFNISRDFIDRCMQKSRFKYEKVRSEHQVGEVNGLYATTNGDGGLLPIQIQLVNTGKHDLSLTGNQGDIMKESMKVATTVVQALISQNKLKSPETALGSLSIHIHATDTAQYKDGPSAGGAIALGLVSKLYNERIHRLCAVTGELDVLGNINAIGGLHSKIQGAKLAGAKTIFYPVENQDDFDIIKEEDPQCMQAMDFVPIGRIEQLLDGALLNSDTIKPLK
jgi:ATP-dependent Lon protease